MKRKAFTTQYPDIFKIMLFDEKSGKWIEPKRGKKFKSRRYVELAGGKKKRLNRAFNTLPEAKAFRLGTLIEESKSGKVAKGDSSEITFSQLVDRWKQNWLPMRNISTQLRYLRYLKHFQFFWEMPVVDIEPNTIDEWLTELKKPSYLKECHSTRCNYEHEFGVLRGILNYYSSRWNRNYRLPFLQDHRNMLKVKEKAAVVKDLSIEQFKDFLKALKMKCWGTKYEVIYYLAMMQYAIYGRIQETAALHVEDFDVKNDRLEIVRKVQWLRYKGYEDRISSGSKANGGKVFAPIPELAVEVLNEWKMRSGVRSGLLFHINGNPIKYRNIQHRYDGALKKAGLPFRSTHILRHASLVQAYSACRDILAVKKLAGHSNLQTTEKYAKVRDEGVERVQRKMDKSLNSIFRK